MGSRRCDSSPPLLAKHSICGCSLCLGWLPSFVSSGMHSQAASQLSSGVTSRPSCLALIIHLVKGVLPKATIFKVGTDRHYWLFYCASSKHDSARGGILLSVFFFVGDNTLGT